MHTINFKGFESKDMGLISLDIGRRQSAQEEIETYQIPYRSEEYVIHTGSYKPYNRPMEFAMLDASQKSEVNAWLKGSGILRTSRDPGGFFRVNVTSGLDNSVLVQNAERFRVDFKINPPFFYLDSGMGPIILTAPGNFTNPGTVEAQPLIEFTGSGTIVVDINGKFFTLTGVDGSIVVDSELQEVYKDTVNQGEKMSGDFPVLPVGLNNVSWTGTVTEVRIIPRWKEL